MAINNSQYFNAAVAGASSGLIRSATVQGDLEVIGEVVLAIATEIDSKIPTDEGESVPRANLIEALTAAATAGRSAISPTATDYSAMATGIAASFSTLKNVLDE